MRINGMIPARMGSNRLKQKNLALIDGKPLISYAINAAKESGVFSELYVNSENDIFKEIAKRYDINFYQRAEYLGGSTIKSDDVVYDFMMNNSSDITVWVNPTSPLQTSEEIKGALDYFISGGYDCLFTVKNEQVHCVLNERPINFNEHGVFAQTQDLAPVGRFVYSLMMWRNDSFIEQYQTNKCAFFCGKIGYYPISSETAVIVKRQEDLFLAESILIARKYANERELKYDELVDVSL